MTQFALAHPILAFLIVIIALFVLASIVGRILRTISVSYQGWPPPHLDADGDWRPGCGDDD